MNIKELEAERVFYFFEEISEIPRGSGDEKAIADYLVNFAKERNLEYFRDDINNVVINKKATVGFENAPTVAIQSHTDMVCEKNNDKIYDFKKDPIKIIYDGDFIRADETTLGGDNGIGVSMALSILDSNDISHPNLEAIFTTYEEVGMDGASKLDMSSLNAQILLNLDSEREGVFTTGCAGGMKASVKIPVEYEQYSNDLGTYLISLIGLRGGHSGIDINKERGNSNKLISRALNILLNKFDEINLCKINGGAKDNAIPREAEAIICFEKSKFFEVEKEVENITNTYRKELKNSDTGINIIINEINYENKCFTKKSRDLVLNGIMLIPNGIQNMDINIKGLPESSNNLGVVRTYDNEVELICAVRSAVSSKKYYIFEQLQSVAKLCSGDVTYRGDYPAWEFNENSVIRKKAVELYKKMYGEEPKINIVHAGLECGLFAEKIPNIDIISLGPNLYDIHTPKERADINSINRVWLFTLKLLKEIGVS